MFESGARKEKGWGVIGRKIWILHSAWIAAKLRFQGSNHCLQQEKLKSLAHALLKEFASADTNLQVHM